MRKACPILISCIVLATVSFAIAGEIDLSKIDTSKLPTAADKKGLTFAKDIRPMLEASCFRCHGQNRPRGGLRLDSLENALKGGDDGKIIVPGNSKKSLLVIAAAQIDPETAMPPKRRPGRRNPNGGPEGAGSPDTKGKGEPRQPPPPGAGDNGQGPRRPGGVGFGPPPKPLTVEQVGILRAWVDEGAK